MMTHALTKGLNQKPAMTKGASPVTPSRGFALWLALLVLYFLLLPSAAETPHRDHTRHDRVLSDNPHQTIDQTLSAAAHYAVPSRAQRPFIRSPFSLDSAVGP